MSGSSTLAPKFLLAANGFAALNFAFWLNQTR